MEQVKIGKFIAELRKNHGFTQMQLAEKLGVSDKTVSRWETGKGMPEISILIPLCKILEVSVNELLTGERLLKDNSQVMYLQEEDERDSIINLMQKTKAARGENRYTIIFCVLACVTVVGIILFTLKQGGTNVIVLLDPLSFLLILIPTILFLVGTGFWGYFWNGISILFGKKADISKETIICSKEAISLAANAMFLMGFLLSVLQIFVLFYNYRSGNWDVFWKNLSVSLFPFLYGIIASLVLLLVRGRLNGEQVMK